MATSKRAPRKHTWYLEPRDSRTNEVFARTLASSTQGGDLGFEESLLKDVLCADDKRHTLWRFPSGLVFMLQRSRSDMRIKFRIWCQEGNGKICNKTRWLSKERGTGRKKGKARRPSHAKF